LLAKLVADRVQLPLDFLPPLEHLL
jgi:hypothetical protein